MRQRVGWWRRDPGFCEDVVDQDAGPGCVQLRPLRDTVDVAGHLGLRESQELRPGPTHHGAWTDLESERPVPKRNTGGRAGGENREALGEGLSGRDPIRMI